MAFLHTKAILAKLLATENLVVQHNSEANTASFDTKTRVLTLPILSTESEYVYNMFVGHEVGHALKTPSNWIDDVPANVPTDFVNVLEDVRIEKYIQSKFPGLRRDFSHGYDELNEMNFFQLEGRDISEFSFIDRLNLHYKLGARALISFSDDEMVYVKEANTTETFKDVCELARKLSEYLKDKKQEDTKQEEEIETPGGSKPSPSTGEGDGDPKESEVGDTHGSDGSSSGNVNEFESETQKSFDESLEDMTEKWHPDVEYMKYTHIDVDENIISIDIVRDQFLSYVDGGYNIHRKEYVDGLFSEFMSSIKGDVNYMVQQFEMKKSADAYSRIQTHKTGVLDTQKLHNYKLTDDIFLRQSTTPDSKNHGMVMYLDWSGSMANISIATVKQIITLVQFCRKVSIPFEVYTFTSGTASRTNEAEEFTQVNKYVHMVQVLTSSAKKLQIDTDILNLWYQSHDNGGYHGLPHANVLQMGGTPLNNALLFVPDIIDKFKQQTGAQKVSFVCVTDGDSAPLTFWHKHTYYGDTCYIPHYATYADVMLRDGYNVYDLGQVTSVTSGLVKWLGDKLCDVDITNIYLAGKSSCIRYASHFDATIDEKLFNKEGACVSTTTSWPTLACINPKTFSDSQDELEVDTGANKGQIRTALKKYLKSKQSSKKLLTHLSSHFA